MGLTPGLEAAERRLPCHTRSGGDWCGRRWGPRCSSSELHCPLGRPAAECRRAFGSALRRLNLAWPLLDARVNGGIY
jgi:hypothetical protein